MTDSYPTDLAALLCYRADYEIELNGGPTWSCIVRYYQLKAHGLSKRPYDAVLTAIKSMDDKLGRLERPGDR